MMVSVHMRECVSVRGCVLVCGVGGCVGACVWCHSIENVYSTHMV